MTEQDEKEWIKRARAGDQIAFGNLVSAYQSPVYNLAYRMLGSPMEAEEAAQEAFIRAYKYLNSYDINRPFSTWLLSITSHYCIDLLRRRRLKLFSLDDESTGAYRISNDSPTPETVVRRRELSDHMQELLVQELSPIDRAAVTLLYWYDHSYEEIADVLDLTVSAVKSRLYRARRTLAEAMEGENLYAV